MDDADRQQFLLFVRGASRLSPDDVFTLQPYQLAPGKDADKYLPTSSTCFFQLNLPAYSSVGVLREKLLFAMQSALTMELD